MIMDILSDRDFLAITAHYARQDGLLSVLLAFEPFKSRYWIKELYLSIWRKSSVISNTDTFISSRLVTRALSPSLNTAAIAVVEPREDLVWDQGKGLKPTIL